MTQLLATHHLSVHYGGVQALTNVDFGIGPGQLVGLIGPNGAGKTTFIDAVTGFAPATGQIVLDTARLDHLPPHKRTRHGLSRTWQGGELFDELSVRENVAVATAHPTARALAREFMTGRTTTPRVVDEALDLLGLTDLRDARIEELGQGQRKLVGVARALARSPKVLLLDEPAAGLDTDESQVLGSHLRVVVESGTSLVLVDHDMGLVLSACDYIVVLNFGQVIAEGTPEMVRTNPVVVEAYLGEESVEVAVAKASTERDVPPAAPLEDTV